MTERPQGLPAVVALLTEQAALLDQTLATLVPDAAQFEGLTADLGAARAALATALELRQGT